MRRSALLFALLLACSPALEGEPTTEPVADWAALASAKDLAFATPAGRGFRTVATHAFVHAGALHLHVFTFVPREDAALTELLAGGSLRVRADGRIRELRAVPLTESAEIEPILPSLVRSEMQMEAGSLRWDPRPARYPATQLRQWFFRLEPGPLSRAR